MSTAAVVPTKRGAKLDKVRLAELSRTMLATRKAWREADAPRDREWTAYMDARAAIAWEVAYSLLSEQEINESDGEEERVATTTQLPTSEHVPDAESCDASAERTPMPVTLRNVQRTLAALHDDITIVAPTPTRHRREHH